MLERTGSLRALLLSAERLSKKTYKYTDALVDTLAARTATGWTCPAIARLS